MINFKEKIAIEEQKLSDLELECRIIKERINIYREIEEELNVEEIPAISEETPVEY